MRHAISVFMLLSISAAAAHAEIPGGILNNSHTCGICHRDIHRMWAESAHARSMEGPVFLTALHNVADQQGEAVTRICLRCHAPLQEKIGDVKLDRLLTWEGVGCDVCHSVASVDTSGASPKFVYDLGGPKRGPIKDAESQVHGVEYSDLHTRSLICYPCHEYVNPQGAAVLSTYTEWRASESATEGKNCQDCHMARTDANVVDPSVKRVVGLPVNLHEVPGGHSVSQLNKAVRAALQYSRQGDELVAEVRITNKGAGHSVPTGMPGRRLVLTLSVKTSDNQTFEEKRVYTKTFADAAGNPVSQDGPCFAPGAKLIADTRLKSGEQRVESFRFHVPATASASISMKVQYDHSPTGRPEDRTYLTVLSEDRFLQASAGSKR